MHPSETKSSLSAFPKFVRFGPVTVLHTNTPRVHDKFDFAVLWILDICKKGYIAATHYIVGILARQQKTALKYSRVGFFHTFLYPTDQSERW